MSDDKWPSPRGRERSMSLAQFEVFQQTQAKLKAEREAELAEVASLRTALAAAESRATEYHEFAKRSQARFHEAINQRDAALARATEAEREAAQWQKQATDMAVRAEGLEDYVERHDYIGGWRKKAEAALARATEAEKALREIAADDDWFVNGQARARSVLSRIAKEDTANG